MMCLRILLLSSKYAFEGFYFAVFIECRDDSTFAKYIVWDTATTDNLPFDGRF